MKVFATEDGGACGYYRIRLPFDHMKANGLDVDYLDKPTQVPDGAVYVGQRVGYPGFRFQWLRLWRDHPLVWETDDDLWSIDRGNVRAATVYTQEMKDEVEQFARIAHMVTVSTPYLADVMSKYSSNVHVLPNHIDGALLEVERPRRDRLTIGWAGGDSHRRDWEFVAPAIKSVLSRNPDVDLHVIGENYLVETRLRGRWSPWSKELFDYYRTIDFDIGIAPLRGSAFNQSKSAIKALEYAALGIPVVASNETPYRDFVEDGVTGFLVSRDHEWRDRLRDLINDEGMRLEMGRKAKERAALWTIQEGWKKWADAYATLG